MIDDVGSLPTPDPDRRRTARCPGCDLLARIDPEVGICPDCYAEGIEEVDRP